MNNIDTQYQNHQQHRANSIPNSSKYLKGGSNMEQNFDALNGMYDQIEMDELAYYNKLFEKEENTMDNNTRATGIDQDDLLNEMYEKIEMDELAYYNKLFEGEEDYSGNREEVENFLKDLDASRDENHYKLLKEVHESYTKDFS